MPRRSKPRELKHLSTGRRRKRIDSVSSGERKRRSPNGEELRDSEGNGLGGRPQRATAPYPEKDACLPERVRRVTRNPGGRRRDHPPRLNTDQ